MGYIEREVYIKKYFLKDELEVKMIDFGWLKEQTTGKGDEGRGNYEFTPISYEDVVLQEKRLGKSFPIELREFYIQVGYGVIGADDRCYLNLVMPPEEVVDFVLGEGVFEGSYCREEIDVETKFVFYDTGDNTYLCLDLGKNSEGICPVVFSCADEYIYIAESLEEFIKKMETTSNYYANLW